MSVKHVMFNNNPLYNTLGDTLKSLEEEGWALSHIVPLSDFESVAVLIKALDLSNIKVKIEDSDKESGSYL